MSKPNAPQHMTTEEKKEALTQCLLSQYRLCAAGVVGGGAFSVIRASKVKATAWPMLGGGFFGTFADFVYGYFVECAHLRSDESDQHSLFGARDREK